MARKRFRYVGIAMLVLSLGGASLAFADGGRKGTHDDTRFHATLIGWNEVPSLNTPGHAQLVLDVTDTTIAFRLTYADLTGPPGAAHIHVGQVGVSGGVSVFFCGGGGGKPACPASSSGTVTGTIDATGVVGPVNQGYAAGDIASVIAALRAGFTYANMHTAKFPSGEIRGQVLPGRAGDHDDDD